MTARAFQMSAQFGGPPGLTTMSNGVANQGWLQGQSAGNQSVINLPAGTILTCAGGSITLKQDGEWLVIIVIDGTPIWSMEFNTIGTWLFGFPIPATWTPQQIYLDFSYVNRTYAANPGAGVEYQISFLAQ